MKRYISEGLESYLNNEHFSWHMPGHKRKGINCGIEKKDKRISIPEILDSAMVMDVTEVPGTDDLHHPEGFIKAAQEELARVYGTFASYYLVNGSTCGIHTAIAACFDNKKVGEHYDIIIARNCHKSVYNAVQLLGLKAVFVEPEQLPEGYPSVEGWINPKKVREICECNEGIQAMVLTSPNYEGVISDIGAISKTLQKYDIKLIVDEAHGAHLPFMHSFCEKSGQGRYISQSAIYLGADIVVQSIHKTFPALTQTAVLHVMNQSLDSAVNKYKSVFMSSSPSYVLLASIENAVAWAEEKDYTEYIHNLTEFRKRVDRLKHVHILAKQDVCGIGACDYDTTRIVLWTDNYMRGTKLEEILVREGNIVCEMAGLDFVVLISTAIDEEKDFLHLYDALTRLDEKLEQDSEEAFKDIEKTIDCDLIEQQIRKIKSMTGQRVRDNIYVYPPGSYILTVGELMTEEKTEQLIAYVKSGKRLRGI